MNFKDMKTGYPVYYLDKEKVEVMNGKMANNASLPHADSTSGNWAQMVVDLPLTVGDKTMQFVVPADADVAYPNGGVITTNRDIISRELDVMENQSEQSLSQMDRHKQIVERCKALKAEFNPAIKEKMETEERFNKLEGSIKDLSDMFAEFMKKLG